MQVQVQSLIWWDNHSEIGSESAAKHFLSGHKVLEHESAETKVLRTSPFPARLRLYFIHPAASTVTGTWKVLEI